MSPGRRHGLSPVPCGCPNGHEPTDALAITRAWLLAVASAATLARDPPAGTGPARSAVLVVLAGLLSLTAATWSALRPRTPIRERG